MRSVSFFLIGSFVVSLALISDGNALSSVNTSAGKPLLEAPAVPAGRSMSREYVTHGVKMEMFIPRFDRGDDSALIVVRNYIPDDPRFESLVPVSSADVCIDGRTTVMTFDPGRNLWSLVLPTGWSLGVGAIRVTAYGANNGRIFSASVENIGL